LRKHRTILVGLGSVGLHVHLPACLESDVIELTAVCDSNKERFKEIPEEYAVKGHYTDLEEALKKEQPEITILAIPPAVHASATEQCVSYGSHVLVEKPLAPSLDEADRIIRAMENSGRKVMVNENYRWFDGILDAKEIIEKGLIGEPHWVQIEVYAPPVRDYSTTGWLRESDKLWFYEWGIHWVDVIRYWLAEEAISVYAHFPKVPPALEKEVINPKADHINAVQIHFEKEKSAFLLQYLVTKGLPGIRVRMTIEADRGAVTITLNGAENWATHFSVYQHSGRSESKSFSYSRSNMFHIGSHLRALQHLVTCIKDDEVPMTVPSDNRKALEIVLASYASAKTRQLKKIQTKG